MKAILFSLLFIFGIALVSCEDDETEPANIEGTWIWQSSCGGFVGCVYTNSTDYKTLLFTKTLLELNENGKITLSGTYTVNSVTGDDNARTYKIELSDGTLWTVSIQHDLLTIEASVITSVYKRDDD